MHTGAIGYYVAKIAEAGLLGIGVVAGMPNMGYTGVRGPAVATSPLAIAAPAPASAQQGRAPLLLDMATATIALGKIRQAKASGTPLPEGAAATLGTLKALPAADDAAGVHYPGERSAAVAQERGANGIPVAPKVWQQLTEAAAEKGVALPTTP
ncbi:Ldh family oxidoreductase [Streptomyces sp. NPDC102467]|uniref:Ldh family oxidoreductase n=1 Tax=Streptomyces sp. NPDC102467 TaxID=3366179 RepID=UPI00380806ED